MVPHSLPYSLFLSVWTRSVQVLPTLSTILKSTDLTEWVRSWVEPPRSRVRIPCCAPTLFGHFLVVHCSFCPVRSPGAQHTPRGQHVRGTGERRRAQTRTKKKLRFPTWGSNSGPLPPAHSKINGFNTTLFPGGPPPQY